MTDRRASASELRADMLSMIASSQSSRLAMTAREQALGRLQGWLAYRFWAGVFTFAAALAILYSITGFRGTTSSHFSFFGGLFVLILVSRIGAIVSIGRRIRTDLFGDTVDGDPVYMLVALSVGRRSMAVALLSANMFGLILYALFASGLPMSLGLNGGIAPEFTKIEADALHSAFDAKDDRASNLELAARQCVVRLCRAKAGPLQCTAGTDAVKPRDSAGAGVGRAGSQAREKQDVDGRETMVPSGTPADSVRQAGNCDDEVDAATAARAEADRAKRAISQRDDQKSQGVFSPLDKVREALGFVSLADLFKMLVWAFVAGFAEKLVPDMLDNLGRINRRPKEA